MPSGRNFFLRVLLGIICFLPGRIFSQCTSTITTFPYVEGFESSDGGWITGGTASDWVWGSPTKPVISGAGEGIKCWVTGGLTGNSYNGNENSWLQSPCFDLTLLSNPQVSFLVYWDSERKFDGASIQYSLDGGLVWNILGSENSNNDCTGSNWFNFSPINFLGGAPGWSGNTQPTTGSCLGGNGSGQWLLARHSLASLSGNTSVSFRFLFGSGNICNDFNGFAVDKFSIAEAPANLADFSTICINPNIVEFSVVAQPCQLGYTWDFGDVGSGSSNFSTLPNPSHAFSTPGTHSVTLTVTYPGGITQVKTKPVITLSANINVTNPLKCSGDQDGSLQVSVAGSSGSYSYEWNTNPVQTTPDLNNLPPGNYIVYVSSVDACPVNTSFQLTEPPLMAGSFLITDERCGNKKGSIAATITGGTTPHNFLWSNGDNTPSITNQESGVYSLQVVDANGCLYDSSNLVINNSEVPVSVSLGDDLFFCPGQSIVLKAGSFASYLWQDGSTAPTYTVSSTGQYYVSVKDNDGCKGSDSVAAVVDCSDINFPSAFTPNGDGRNDTFGPLGELGGLKDYTLKIYNRWGALIYSTSDPYEKWNGNYKGKMQDIQTLCWIASYTLNGKNSGIKKGTLVILHE